MKRYSAALLGVSLMIASPAMASDIFGKGGSTKDDTEEVSYGRNPFGGFYLGAQVGGQFTNIDIAPPGLDFDGIGADGLIGGLHAGYNACVNRVCFGPYVEGGFGAVNSSINGTDIVSQDYYVQGGVMLGYMVGKASLISVHGGYDYAKWSSEVLTAYNQDDDITVSSFVVGGGVDTMLTSNISLGLKVDYLMFSNVDANDQDYTDFLDQSESLRAQLRLTYRR